MTALVVQAFVVAGYTETEGRRFAAKLRLTESGCWEWTACTNSKGYGCLGLRKVAWLAHRLAHVVFIGPIPEGFQVDHVKAKGCTSIRCCNPDHLEAVTGDENMARRWDLYVPAPITVVDLSTPSPRAEWPAPIPGDREAADLISRRLDALRVAS